MKTYEKYKYNDDIAEFVAEVGASERIGVENPIIASIWMDAIISYTYENDIRNGVFKRIREEAYRQGGFGIDYREQYKKYGIHRIYSVLNKVKIEHILSVMNQRELIRAEGYKPEGLYEAEVKLLKEYNRIMSSDNVVYEIFKLIYNNRLDEVHGEGLGMLYLQLLYGMSIGEELVQRHDIIIGKETMRLIEMWLDNIGNKEVTEEEYAREYEWYRKDKFINLGLVKCMLSSEQLDKVYVYVRMYYNSDKMHKLCIGKDENISASKKRIIDIIYKMKSQNAFGGFSMRISQMTVGYIQRLYKEEAYKISDEAVKRMKTLS